THEVAYGSLLADQKRELHASLVEAIERLHAERLEEQVERLAYHAVSGELWEKALHYLSQAGARAYGRAAHREAVGYFEQALVALTRLPEQPGRVEKGIDLRFGLQLSLLPLGELRRGLAFLREAEPVALAHADQRRIGWLYIYMTGQLYLTGES